MELLKLIVRNVFRHTLRAGLTMLGVAIAVLAFCLLSTLVAAWQAGVDASSPNRLVTRNKISLIYSLPLAYKSRIHQVSGVTDLGHGSWYGGIYKDKKNFFAQFAVCGSEYLDLFPEFRFSLGAKQAFDKERSAAVAGRKLVQRFGWKIGDVIPLQGTIFPGNIELVLKGIYWGAHRGTDETAFFFRWDFLNERLKTTMPERADRVSWYFIRIKEAERAAEISREIDRLFENSLAETITETEKAFQAGFVAMTEAIMISIQVISVVVIVIILIVLANTVAMTARERSSEYAVLKTLGFRPWFLFRLVAGESVALAMIGGVIGTLLTYPAVWIVHPQVDAFLPILDVKTSTLVAALVVSLVVGLLAALPPILRIMRQQIADGLRHIG
jgi:putative ABC transport system permease protein